MGHATSCLTIINLIWIGNKKVLKKFNCQKLRTGSRNVTMATTGAPPHPKQPVCGERALDVVFTLTFLTRDPGNCYLMHGNWVSDGMKEKFRLINLSPF